MYTPAHDSIQYLTLNCGEFNKGCGALKHQARV